MGPLLLCGDERVPVPPAGLTIGREPVCDLVLDDERVSRRHAVVRAVDGAVEVEDLGSTNGTVLDGERLRGGRRVAREGSTIVVGGTTLRCLGAAATATMEHAPEPGQAFLLRDAGERLTIGREAGNDIVLDDPNVSRCHAELVAVDGGLEVRDLGSRNGTRVDGRRVERAVIAEGAELAIGPFRILYGEQGLQTRDERCAVDLEARGVAVRAGDREIVAPTDLVVRPGELVAVIGRSGSGKSSLVKALAGVVEPAAGEVMIGGEPLADRLTDVGYLPQDEIVHRQLTPREALRYAGRLRLPDDVTGEELDALAAGVLEELGLGDRADTRIGRLSGGERKRAGLAVELVGRPSILFLDEPTTGLDAGLEAQTMELLRRLADRGRSVVVVTHATGSLELCDRVIVMAPGGQVAYDGPPAGVAAHFGVGAVEEVYDAAEATAPAAPAADGDGDVRPGRAVAAAPRNGALRQVRALTARHARIFVRDRRNLLVLLAQVPLLGAAIGAIFGADVFVRERRGNPNDAAQVLFLLATTAIWIGALASAREIVKERTVVARERAIGVRLSAYLASKLLLLGSVVAAQAAVLAAIVTAMRPLHEPPAVYAQVVLLTVLTALAAVGMGLWLSAMARSQDQAMSFIPLALVPQLLFAGALVPVSKMGDALQAVSALAFSRWSFSGLGTAVDMAGRLRGDRYDARYSPFRRSFFDTAFPEAVLVLGAFIAAFAVLTLLALRRRTRPGA